MAQFAFRIRREDTLRVPDNVLSCVGFVCERIGLDATHENLDPVGTGFLISIPSQLPNVRTFVFITNKHVLEDAPQVPKVVTVNGFGLGRLILKTEGEWQNHPDSTVDLAGICVAENPGSFISAFGIEDLFDEGNNLIPGLDVATDRRWRRGIFPWSFYPGQHWGGKYTNREVWESDDSHDASDTRPIRGG